METKALSVIFLSEGEKEIPHNFLCEIAVYFHQHLPSAIDIYKKKKYPLNSSYTCPFHLN